MTQKPKKAARRPVVGIPCDVKMLGPHPFHAVGEKYINAVMGGAECLAVLIPVPTTPIPESEIFDLCDGIFLTGSWSNVHPDLYGGPPSRDGVLHDPQRDALTLSLIRHSVDRGVPIFMVCRGFQELNVAFGGTLHQHLEETESEPGFAARFDHREDKEDPLDVQYGLAHEVHIEPGGLVEELLGTRTIRVNSLHGQGVAKLGKGLKVEGRAPDGTVEALSVEGAKSFALGVQWHPEWKYADNPVSLALFRAFGDAVREAAARKDQIDQTESGQSNEREPNARSGAMA